MVTEYKASLTVSQSSCRTNTRPEYYRRHDCNYHDHDYQLIISVTVSIFITVHYSTGHSFSVVVF